MHGIQTGEQARGFMKLPLRILFVEDSESDSDLIVRHLNKTEYSVHYERVETAKNMTKMELETRPWDLVISDYKLPRFNAAAALALLQKTNLDIPFIIVSGSDRRRNSCRTHESRCT